MPELTYLFEGEGNFNALNDVLKDRLRCARSPLLVSVDGRSGTGKTTLANFLLAQHHGVVIHGDDFCDGGSFEEWKECTPQDRYRLSKNWKRLRDDALLPLRLGEAAVWHAYDWNAEALSTELTIVEAKPLVILEGVFSARPELIDLIDVSILADVQHDERTRRIASREGDAYMNSWFPIWEEAEDFYFNSIIRRQSFDIIYSNT